MFRLPLFGSVHKSASRRNRGRRNRPQPRRRLIWLEPLEDRSMLSYLVTNLSDNGGSGSLRYELNQANAAAGAQTVEFAPHLVGTITLDAGKGPLAISNAVTIDGPGADRITVSGGDATQVLDISAGATANVTGLSITHGLAVQGGAIDNQGDLALSGDVLAHNHAVGVTTIDGQGGGAIFNEVGATLSIDHTALTSNTATAAPNSDVFGGALLNQGSATVSDSLFEGNQSLGGSGVGTVWGGSVGGAIDNYGSATLTISHSALLNNQAVSAAGPFFAIGGAIENNAGPTNQVPASSLVIDSTLIAGNVARGGGAGATSNGGAIDNGGPGTNTTITHSAIIGNQAIGGDGADGETALGQAEGGALLNLQGTMDVEHTLLANNRAQGGDHATITTDNPLTGGGIGGAIINAFGSLTVTDSSFAGNQAVGGFTDAGPGATGAGGAIANEFLSTLTLTNSTLSGNLALGGQGGGGTSSVPAGLGVGGAIDDSFYSTATINGGAIDFNKAIGGAGGANGNGGDGLGGAIAVGMNQWIGFSDDSSLTVVGTAVDHNLAEGGRGGRGGSGGDGLGGGVIVFSGSSAQFTSGEIEHNDARGAPGGRGIGGGVYNAGVFSSSGTTIKHNHASTSNDDIFG